MTYWKRHKKRIFNRYSRISLNSFEDSIEFKKIAFYAQTKKVIKGVWRMPWILEARKDVISCDKLGGEANTHYIPRFPNGATRCTEGTPSRKRSKPAELKHLSRRRRRK